MDKIRTFKEISYKNLKNKENKENKVWEAWRIFTFSIKSFDTNIHKNP